MKIMFHHFPQDDDATERAEKIVGDNSKKLRGVYRAWNEFQARPFIGGRQIMLAKGGVHPCIRFADAAVLYFWPYRKRPNREPIDTDFNLGIDRARKDLDNCAWLVEYLKSVEFQLTQNGILRPEDRKERRGPAFDREIFLLRWQSYREMAEKFAAELKRTGEPAKFFYAAFSESLDAHAKVIESADRQFIRPASFEPRDTSLEQIH